MKANYHDARVIRSVLENSHTIAVVGLSDNPQRPSNDVATFLQSKGYRIIPVNPTITEALGERAYRDLKSIPDSVDVVDIFRRSEDVGPVVEDAISIRAKTVWMQLGIENEAAAKMAADAGLHVVMDRCMKREFQRIRGWHSVDDIEDYSGRPPE